MTSDLGTVLAPLDRLTLGEQVYRDVRALLIAGQLAPGDRLTIRGLADALCTSPMPVRAAVQRLMAEGALDVTPNRAIRVPAMTRARFEELRTIRIAVEGLAAWHAAYARTEADLASVRRHHLAFGREVQKAKPELSVAIRHNQELHFAVYQAARMPTLMSIIEGLWLQVGPVLSLDLRTSVLWLTEVPAHEHHTQLLAALERGDGEGARQAVANDIETAASFILARGLTDDEG